MLNGVPLYATNFTSPCGANVNLIILLVTPTAEERMKKSYFDGFQNATGNVPLKDTSLTIGY